MKIALIGDVHGYFDEFDVEYFNQSEYDCILFTGDLADFFHIKKGFYKILNKLNKHCYLIWGNHDGFNFKEVVSELFQFSIYRVNKKKIPIVQKRLDFLRYQLGSHFICGGYKLSLLSDTMALFMVRPHSIGGNRIGYLPFLEEVYNINNFDDTFLKMKNLLDTFLNKFPKVKSLIFLGHNGPYGINRNPNDLWGCDFNPKLGDFGDLDFYKIIDYAKKKVNVLLVVAGHMHHKISKKGLEYLKNQESFYNQKERLSITKIDDIYYINPAKVPRIFKQNHQKVHYHVYVEFIDNKIKKVEEKWITE